MNRDETFSENYIPNAGSIITESLKAANHAYFRYSTYNSSNSKNEVINEIRDMADDLHKEYLKKLKSTKLTKIKYIISKNQEKNITKHFHSYQTNRLARVGYLDAKRKRDYNSQSLDTYNRILTLMGPSFRFFSDLYFIFADPLLDLDGRPYYLDEKTGDRIYISHLISSLEFIECLRPHFDELASYYTYHDISNTHQTRLLTEFIIKACQKPLTTLYAGSKSRATDLPLNGPAYPRRNLYELVKQYKHLGKKYQVYRSTITTASQQLDNFESLAKDPLVRLLKMGIESKYHEFFTEKHAKRIFQERAKRTRKSGNEIHNIAPYLFEWPSKVWIGEMFESPEKFDVYGIGYLFATEVKYYYKGQYGEIDFLILKRIQIETDDQIDPTTLIIPIILGDRKVKRFEEWNFAGKRKKYNHNQIRPEVKAIRQIISEEKFDEIAHNTLNDWETDQYTKQLNIYSNGVKQISRDKNAEVYDADHEPFKIILLSDAAIKTSDLIQQEKLLILNFLMELEGEILDRDLDLLQRFEIKSHETPNVRIISQAYHGNPDYLLNLPISTESYTFDPFEHRQEKRETDLFLYFPVSSPHPSNPHVSLLTSFEYLIVNIAKGLSQNDKALILDLSGWLTEFQPTRLFGINQNQNLKDILKTKFDIVSFLYPDEDIPDLDQYHTILVHGLNILDKINSPRHYDILKVKLLEHLKTIANTIYLIENPKDDAGISKNHRRSSIVPFSNTDSIVQDQSWKSQINGIYWNLPRRPVSIKTLHPIRDEQRLILLHQPNGTITSEFLSFDRFIGHSIKYKNPRKYERILKKSTDRDYQTELQAALELLPWLQTDTLSHKRQKFSDIFDFIDLSIENHEYSQTKTQLFTYNPNLDISGRFREFISKDLINRTFLPSRGKLLKRSIKKVSTLTPRSSEFEALPQFFQPSDMIYKIDISHLRNVMLYISGQKPLPYFSTLSDKALDNAFEVFIKSNTSLISILDAILKEFANVSDLPPTEQKYIFKKLRNHLQQHGTKLQRGTLTHFYSFICRTSENDIQWYEDAPIGHWLILLILSIWEYRSDLKRWHIHKLFTYLSPWIFVQLNIPIRKNTRRIRVSTEKYQLLPGRIFNHAFKMVDHIKELDFDDDDFVYRITNIRHGIFRQTLSCKLITINFEGDLRSIIISTPPNQPLEGISYKRAIRIDQEVIAEISAQYHDTPILLVSVASRQYIYEMDVTVWTVVGQIRLFGEGNREDGQYFDSIRILPEILPSIPIDQVRVIAIPNENLLNPFIEALTTEIIISCSLTAYVDTEDINFTLILTNEEQNIELYESFELVNDVFGFVLLPKYGNYYNYNGSKLTWDPNTIIIEDETGRLQDLFSFLWIYNLYDKAYPQDIYEFLDLADSESYEEVSTILTIDHDEQVDHQFRLQRVIKKKEIEGEDIDIPNHLKCFSIEVEEEAYEALSYYSGIEITPNKKLYFETKKIKEIASIPYIIFNNIIYKFEVRWGGSNPDVLYEDDDMYWVGREFFPRVFASKLVFSSHEANERWILTGLSIGETSLVSTWKEKGYGYVVTKNIAAMDSCDLAISLGEFLEEEDLEILTRDIEEKNIIELEDTKSHIFEEVQMSVDAHLRECQACLDHLDVDWRYLVKMSIFGDKEVLEEYEVLDYYFDELIDEEFADTVRFQYDCNEAVKLKRSEKLEDSFLAIQSIYDSLPTLDLEKLSRLRIKYRENEFNNDRTGKILFFDYGTFLMYVGHSYWDMREFEEALKHYKVSENERDEGHYLDKMDILDAMGSIYYWLKNYDLALDHYEKGVEILHENGSEFESLRLLRNIFLILLEEQEFSKALDYAKNILRLSKIHGTQTDISNSLQLVGKSYQHLGQSEIANEYYSKSSNHLKKD